MSTQVLSSIEKESNNSSRDWRVLEFYVPIKEVLGDNNEFLIKGVAINETTTLNNVKYVAEELIQAASTFRNVPILLDHKNEVKNIVGRTTENVNWNETFRRIDFEAQIMDKDIIERIKDGRIGSVSIGAKVDDLTEEEDGSMKAIGVRGLEISLVAVPGDSHANIAQAIKQGLHLKEMAGQKQLNMENKEMVEQTKTEVAPEESPVEVPEEAKDEPKEEPEEEAKDEPEKAEEKVQKLDVKIDTTELTEMKAQIAELKELLTVKKELVKKIKEDAEDEDETKGEVSTEAEETLEGINNMIVEQASRGYAMYRDYASEADGTNLKRLVR